MRTLTSAPSDRETPRVRKRSGPFSNLSVFYSIRSEEIILRSGGHEPRLDLICTFLSLIVTLRLRFGDPHVDGAVVSLEGGVLVEEKMGCHLASCGSLF